MSVTPYASSTQLKLHLGIIDSSQDTLIDDLLSTTYRVINSLLDINSFNLGPTTQEFSLDDIRANGTVLAKNYPVTSITHINGTAYTGVLGTDYKIAKRRELRIDDLNTYITNLTFPFFTITYTSGYVRTVTDTLPEDIKRLQLKLCTEEYNTRKTSGISNYRLGDESMSFNSIIGTDPVIQKILSKYKKANVI